MEGQVSQPRPEGNLIWDQFQATAADPSTCASPNWNQKPDPYYHSTRYFLIIITDNVFKVTHKSKHALSPVLQVCSLWLQSDWGCQTGLECWCSGKPEVDPPLHLDCLTLVQDLTHWGGRGANTNTEPVKPKRHKQWEQHEVRSPSSRPIYMKPAANLSWYGTESNKPGLCPHPVHSLTLTSN